MTKPHTTRIRRTVHARERGVTLLLVILVVSAILAIAVTIFASVYGQLRLASDIAGSFQALYAADEGMERIFYCDRIPSSGCTPCAGQNGACTIPSLQTSNPDACAIFNFNRTGNKTTIVSTGEYKCGGGIKALRRAFQATY